jgi:hypothetical protein
VVRLGSLPEREVQTGLGAVRVKGLRGRDRRGRGMRLHSALLPPYIRRSKSLEALLPWLYLTGVSTGDCSEALRATLGARGARALSGDDQPAQTGLARGTDAGAKLQPPGQTVGLFLGGWRLRRDLP